MCDACHAERGVRAVSRRPTSVAQPCAAGAPRCWPLVVAGAAAGAGGRPDRRAERPLSGVPRRAPSAGTITVDGERRSLTVDPEAYAASRHGLIDCTGCHIGFKPGEHSAAETEDWLYIARVAACAHLSRRRLGRVRALDPRRHRHQARGRRGADLRHLPRLARDRDDHATRGLPPEVARPSAAPVTAAVPTPTSTPITASRSCSGAPDSATCVDCHGAHLVLPASNPASTVSDENIVATCQTCHPEANESFATYIVHDDPTNPDQIVAGVPRPTPSTSSS